MKNIRSVALTMFAGLLLLSTAAAVMLLVRYIAADSTRFNFLIWNLILAWLPAILSLWFTYPASRQRPAVTILIFILWLLFLPNTFYVLTDFVHLRASGDINILFDAVLLFSFASTGLVLGYLSLGLVHLWLRRVTEPRISTLIVYLVIFASSFAIYLGRYLRWNSWDIVANPFGLIVDVSDRVISPLEHPRTISTTLVFFIFIGVSYLCIWRLASYFHRNKKLLLKI